MLDLEGKGAIFAGTRRVGATVVRRLAREGVRPAIIYRNSRAEAEALLESVKTETAGHGCLIKADLADENSVRSAVSEAREKLGDLSFCVNLAADYPRTPFENLDASAWDQGMASARASYLLALHASRAMSANTASTRGHIILFGDWAAQETPYPHYLPYLTGKAAIHFMTRGLALELAPQRILVNAILPGPTARPADMPQEQWQEALMLAPLHRESAAEEIAELVATLLKMETITGENIRVDSGRHIVGPGLPKDMSGS